MKKENIKKIMKIRKEWLDNLSEEDKEFNERYNKQFHNGKDIMKQDIIED